MAEPNVVPFVRRDGTAEFNCTECGTHVLRYTGDGPTICMVCAHLAGWQWDPKLRSYFKPEDQP